MAKATKKTAQAKKTPATGKSKTTRMQIAPPEETPPLSEFQKGAALESRGTQHTPPPPEAKKKEKQIMASVNGLKVSYAKYDPKTMTLEWKFQKRESDSTQTGSLSSDAVMHQDLINAFDALNIHIATWGEQYKKGGSIDADNVKCTGISVKTGNIYGVALIGRRTLSEGKNFNVNAPFLRLDEQSPYPLYEEVDDLITTVLDEVVEYINGKHAVSQGDLFGTAPAEAVTDAEKEPPYSEDSL